MYEVFVASGATVVGVVLGAGLSYASTRRAQVSKSLQDARISAFTRFAASSMEYRRALMERWFTQQGAAPTAVATAHGVHECRSAAWAALFEVQLVAADSAVGSLARAAIDATSAIKDAEDRRELVTRAEHSRDSVDAFVSAARVEIEAGGK